MENFITPSKSDGVQKYIENIKLNKDTQILSAVWLDWAYLNFECYEKTPFIPPYYWMLANINVPKLKKKSVELTELKDNWELTVNRVMDFLKKIGDNL